MDRETDEERALRERCDKIRAELKDMPLVIFMASDLPILNRFYHTTAIGPSEDDLAQIEKKISEWKAHVAEVMELQSRPRMAFIVTASPEEDEPEKSGSGGERGH